MPLLKEFKAQIEIVQGALHPGHKVMGLRSEHTVVYIPVEIFMKARLGHNGTTSVMIGCWRLPEAIMFIFDCIVIYK